MLYVEHFKGSQLGAFCPLAILYWYLEFKLRYLKNLKLFSIRVKELFEPTVLRKNRRFFFFFFFFLLSIFLRNRSLSNAVCFYNKTRKIGKGNLYSIMWCAADMCHICAKGFLDSNFKQLLTNMIFFKKL